MPGADADSTKFTNLIFERPATKMCISMVRKLFTQAGMPEDGDFSWTSFLMFIEDIELPAEATSKDFEEAC